MKQMRTEIVALALVCGGHVGSVIAVEFNAPGSGRARQLNKGSAVNPADSKNSVRAGVVTAVDTAGRRVEISGQWYTIVDGRTRLLQQGRPVLGDVLKTGQAVKFTLADGGAADGRKLGVLYVP